MTVPISTGCQEIKTSSSLVHIQHKDSLYLEIPGSSQVKGPIRLCNKSCNWPGKIVVGSWHGWGSLPRRRGFELDFDSKVRTEEIGNKVKKG